MILLGIRSKSQTEAWPIVTYKTNVSMKKYAGNVLKSTHLYNIATKVV